VGKTSTARILARAVNCPNLDLKGEVEPCNKCETCLALLEDRELDVIEMDAASYTGVDDIRSVIDAARLAPIGGRKKVFIIDEVHMLSKNAFNAFLKTLEEPPPHVIFVLATTDVQKVPATILSRVQRFDFRPVQPQDIEPHLEMICTNEKWKAEPEALWLIARRAEGSLRDAEGLLDQVVSFGGGEITYDLTRQILGVLSGELLAEATRLIAQQSLDDVPKFFDTLVKRGTDYAELLRSLQAYWTDLVFLKEGLPLTGKPAEEIAQMQEASGDLAVEDAFRLIRLAENLEDAIRWSTAPRVRFEVAFLRWVTMDRAVVIKDILDRIDASAPEGHEPPGPARSTASRHNDEGSRLSAAGPAIAVNQPSATTAPISVTTTNDLRALWPDVVRKLQKRSPAAGAVAESVWEIESFDGRKLVMRCKRPGVFYEEQLRENFPHLTAAIHDVTGLQVVPIASAELPGGARPAPVVTPETTAAKRAPAASSPGGESDLFSNFVNRIGGVEIDPKTLRGPKSTS
jgi:DNA polymerase-3 subunit gamma/tau